MLTPKAAIASVFRNYATFSGRAPRSEYWWFQLFQTVLFIVVILVGALPTALSGSAASDPEPTFALAGTGFLLLGLGLFIPNISVFVRRLHDINFSGWFYFLAIIPGFGSIITLVFTLLPSNPDGARFDAAENFGTDTPAWKAPQNLG